MAAVVRNALNLRRGILEDRMKSKDKKKAKEAREEYLKVKELITQFKAEGELEMDEYLQDVIDRWQGASPTPKTLTIKLEDENIESGENI